MVKKGLKTAKNPSMRSRQESAGDAEDSCLYSLSPRERAGVRAPWSPFKAKPINPPPLALSQGEREQVRLL